MKFKPILNTIHIIVLSSVLVGCQALSPKIQGIPHVATMSHYDDLQAEIFWQDKSFAFLLSQQKHHDGWQIHALTLSGQLLFEMFFDGKQFTTIQKHRSLATLPVEFLIRDVWWAILPKDDVAKAITPLGLSLTQNKHGRQIIEADKVRLDVIYDGQITINNQQVPYQLILNQTTQSVLQHEQMMLGENHEKTNASGGHCPAQ